MTPQRLTNSLFLALLSCGLSGTIVLFLLQNPQLAWITGMISFPSSSLILLLQQHKIRQQDQKEFQSLSLQIEQLEREELQLHHTLQSTYSFYQQIETNVATLQAERSLLVTRLSELYWQRNQLYQDLARLRQQQQQKNQEVSQKQFQLEQIQKKQAELNYYLSHSQKVLEHKPFVDRLQEQLESLKNQITEYQRQRDELSKEYHCLQQNKQDLTGKKSSLENQIKALEQRVTYLQQQHLNLATQVIQEKTNLETLSEQIAEKQYQKQELTLDIDYLSQAKQQLEGDIYYLEGHYNQQEKQEQSLNFSYQTTLNPLIPTEWRDWVNFVQKLSPEDCNILRKILTDNQPPSPSQNITMPDILVESLSVPVPESLSFSLPDPTSLESDPVNMIAESLTVDDFASIAFPNHS